MNRQLVRQKVLAVTAIVLLSVLFALSRSTDPSAHARLVDLLRGARESEEMLGRVVLEISTRRLLTYDPILTAEQGLEQSVAEIQSDPAMRVEPEAGLLERNAMVVKDRRALIEHFKTTDAVYHNSSLSQPLLMHKVTGRFRAAGQFAIADAIEDWDQILFLRLHERVTEAEFNAATSRLRALSGNAPEVSHDIELLVSHAQVLVGGQEATGELVGQILDASGGELLSEIYRTYMEGHVAADRRAGWVLYALYASAFLCVVSLVALSARVDRIFKRLTSTNRLLKERGAELRRLSAELTEEIHQREAVQQALKCHRDNLECQVAERTADLVASKAYLVDAIETLPEAFVLFDPDDRLLVCNTAYRSLFRALDLELTPGLGYEEIVRLAFERKLFEIKSDDPERCLLDRFSSHRAVGSETVRSDFRLSDGRWIEMLDRRTRDGGFVSLLIDVTEARRRDEMMAQRSKQAALGQLAGGVAHEINNLLQPALTFPELVRDRLPPEDIESREDLDMVLDSVRKAREVVRNILLFSRKQEPTLEIVDLAAETQKALKFVRDLLPPGISLHHVIVDPGVTAAINRTQLTQVLTNLVINAAHASSDHGMIAVTLGRAQPSAEQAEHLGIDAGSTYATLAVADNGTGMDAATMAHIFEPFFTTKPQGEGTGLGLSVVFGILKSWKGAIAVDSTLGSGTVFTLYIPMVVRDRAAETAPSIAA